MIKSVVGLAAAGVMLMGPGAGQAQEKVRVAIGACPVQCPQAPPSDYPPDAKPGQCFAKVRTPPVRESYAETVVVTPARKETRTVPAVYDTVDRRVLVKPERVERTTVPATYRTVYETVIVRPGSVRYKDIAPVYRTSYETVLVREARTEWRRSYIGPGGFIPSGSRVEPTGEVMCLVEIPAVYDRVARQVMVEPGRSVRIEEPPVTRTQARQIVDRPARVVETRIAAVYRTDRVRQIVRPERTEVIDIPAVTRVVTKEREVGGGRDEWRQIDCPPSLAPPPAPAHAAPPPPPPRGPEKPGIPPRKYDGERG